jgi:hypothetical protein
MLYEVAIPGHRPAESGRIFLIQQVADLLALLSEIQITM